MQHNTLVSPEDVAEQGLREIGSADAGVSQINGHRVALGGDFSLDPIFITSRENQETSLGAGVLDCRAHQRIDQLLQHDLTDTASEPCPRSRDQGVPLSSRSRLASALL